MAEIWYVSHSFTLFFHFWPSTTNNLLWVLSDVKQHCSTYVPWVSLHVHAAAYLSSFWKLWSPSSRSLKRKRGGSGGTSLSCCSILSVEMSKITPLLLMLVWSGAGEELEEGKENSKEAEGRWREKKCKSEGEFQQEMLRGNKEQGRRGSKERKHGWKSAGGGLIQECRKVKNRGEKRYCHKWIESRKFSTLSFGDYSFAVCVL